MTLDTNVKIELGRAFFFNTGTILPCSIGHVTIHPRHSSITVKAIASIASGDTKLTNKFIANIY